MEPLRRPVGDETYIRVSGRWTYLYRDTADNGKLLAKVEYIYDDIGEFLVQQGTPLQHDEGYQMNCVNEFPSSVGTRPSKMIEKACIA